MYYPIGSTHTNSLNEIWNSDEMKKLRSNMLAGEPSAVCNRCYEQDDNGFFSGRKSANKHHGHHIARVDKTDATGHLHKFKMSYWDVRFSNLCNLSCRSCGHIFSSSWYKDQVALAGEQWGKDNKALQIAGRNKDDMFEQLMEHIDYVEQIYFAGGEPLMMEEHYKILDELEKREMFHVRLIYNTNFTITKLKDRDVFDYWRKFDSVSVGASLDAMGPQAEYIRKGTKWDVVEANRRKMLEVCPDVDFYISPTLSILNAMHITDFHRDWVEKGYLKPQDLNINILQDPPEYRIDIAPPAYKDKIRDKFQAHIEWLKDKDPLNRATTGFESAIKFMDATDNTHLIPAFWKRMNQLDGIRKDNFLDSIIEIIDIR
jgi:sulfatase maturation enzyme AslB (radical SAM superfamily)